MFDPYAYELLCLSSIRRLFAKRHSARDGEEARATVRRWMRDLRQLRAAY